MTPPAAPSSPAASTTISPLARAPAIAVTEQPFEAAELAGRLARVRAAMAAQGLDLLMVTDPNDIYYLSGARELAGRMQMALLVAGTGAPAFVGRAVDAVAFIAHTGNANTFDYHDHEPPEGALAMGIAKMAGAAARVGYNAANLTSGMLARAQAALPDARFVDATRLVWDLMALKSEAELAHMRAAGRINTKALDRALAAIKPGVSDNRISAELYAGMMDNGSHPTTHYMLATGPRTAVVHATFNDRKLEADDIVHFEFTAARFWYTAPLMRTATLGRPHPAAVKLHDGTLAAVEAAMRTIKEGATSGAVDAAANAELEKRGVRQWHYHRTGYMVGIAASGTWGLGHIGALREADPLILRAGMTFHLPMVLFEPGQAGAGLSETVLVTKTGCEPLTSYPTRELIRL